MKNVLKTLLMVVITVCLCNINLLAAVAFIAVVSIFSPKVASFVKPHVGITVFAIVAYLILVFYFKTFSIISKLFAGAVALIIIAHILNCIGSAIYTFKERLLYESFTDIIKNTFKSEPTENESKLTLKLKDLFEQIISYPERARDGYVRIPQNKADRKFKHYREYFKIMFFCNLYLLRDHSDNYMYQNKKKMMKSQMNYTVENTEKQPKSEKQPKAEKQSRKPLITKNNMKKIVKPMLVVTVILVALLALTKCETKQKVADTNSLPQVEINADETDNMKDLQELQIVENSLDATEKEQALLEEKLQKLEEEKQELEDAKQELEQQVETNNNQNNYNYEDNTTTETPQIETPQIVIPKPEVEKPEVEKPEVEEPEIVTPNVKEDKTLPEVAFQGVNETIVGDEICITINTVDDYLKAIDINKISIENAEFEVEKIANEKVNVYVTFDEAGSYSFTVAEAYAVDESNNNSIMTTMNITVEEKPEIVAPVVPEEPEIVVPEVPEEPETVEPEVPEEPEIVEPEVPEEPEIVEPEVPEEPEIVQPEEPEIVTPEVPEEPEIVEPEVPETVVDTTRPEITLTLPEVIKEYEAFTIDIQLSDDVKIDNIVVNEDLLILPEGMKLLDLSLITEDSLKAIIQVDEAVANSMITIQEGLVYDEAGNTNLAKNIKVEVEEEKIEQEPEVQEEISFQLSTANETVLSGTTFIVRSDVLSGDIENITINPEDINVPEGVKILEVKKLDDHFDIIMTTDKDCAGTLEFSLEYSTNTVVIEIKPGFELPNICY